MTTITLPRATVEQALEALEYAQQDRECPSTTRQAIAALRAALAQAEPELSRCPQCNGPADNGFDRSFPPSPYLCKKCMAEPVGPGAWVASKDGRVIYDDASTDDGLLRVSGDFENDEQRSRYAQRIVDKLNAALAQQAEPVSADPHTTTLRALLECCLSWEPDACVLGNVTARQAITALKAALAQRAEPVQEPVAWRFKPMIGSPWSLSDDGYYISCKRDKGYIVEPLYAAPPQRKPLPNHDQHCVDVPGYGLMAVRLVRAVERAHGIKE